MPKQPDVEVSMESTFDQVAENENGRILFDLDNISNEDSEE